MTHYWQNNGPILKNFKIRLNFVTCEQFINADTLNQPLTLMVYSHCLSPGPGPGQGPGRVSYLLVNGNEWEHFQDLKNGYQTQFFSSWKCSHWLTLTLPVPGPCLSPGPRERQCEYTIHVNRPLVCLGFVFDSCTQHYMGTFCQTDRDDHDYTTIYIVIGVVTGIIVVVGLYLCYVLQKQKKGPPMWVTMQLL